MKKYAAFNISIYNITPMNNKWKAAALLKVLIIAFKGLDNTIPATVVITVKINDNTIYAPNEHKILFFLAENPIAMDAYTLSIFDEHPSIIMMITYIIAIKASPPSSVNIALITSLKEVQSISVIFKAPETIKMTNIENITTIPVTTIQNVPIIILLKISFDIVTGNV